ncbi:unnamed protein product [Lepeophtheirus salmonis]|uniref:(salmon louse) hypothetical protein n=1 Tax=Lepeophtheirus salmonis TaxID=72036 RepID=A0A7R8D427_LEPSM|nr:unnamed protein product [Lepeophtheirus salmonis]CAF3021914.1 unnamed protein product [Lepeophtheirus salmonis]
MGKKQNATKLLRKLEETRFLGKKAIEDLRSLPHELEAMTMEDIKASSKIAVVEQEVVHMKKKKSQRTQRGHGGIRSSRRTLVSGVSGEDLWSSDTSSRMQQGSLSKVPPIAPWSPEEKVEWMHL